MTCLFYPWLVEFCLMSFSKLFSCLKYCVHLINYRFFWTVSSHRNLSSSIWIHWSCYTTWRTSCPMTASSWLMEETLWARQHTSWGKAWTSLDGQQHSQSQDITEDASCELFTYKKKSCYFPKWIPTESDRNCRVKHCVCSLAGCHLGGSGDSNLFYRQGYLSGILRRTPKRYQDPVLWVWLEIFLP